MAAVPSSPRPPPSQPAAVQLTSRDAALSVSALPSSSQQPTDPHQGVPLPSVTDNAGNGADQQQQQQQQGAPTGLALNDGVDTATTGARNSGSSSADERGTSHSSSSRIESGHLAASTVVGAAVGGLVGTAVLALLAVVGLVRWRSRVLQENVRVVPVGRLQA